MRMNIGHLDIHSVPGRMDYSSQSEQLTMRQPLPHLSITRQQGGMELQTVPLRAEIDSSACRAEEGDMTVSEFISQAAQEGMQSIRDFTSQLTDNGLYVLKNFHKSKNVYADMARSKTLPEPKQLNLRFIPSAPPDIHFTGGTMQMDIKPEQMQLDWDVHPNAEISVRQEHSLNFRMTQYPSLTIDYIPPTMDTTA